mgnify:CR=1 FL=1
MIGVLCCIVLWFFFFQAEDGIRDAQESRGLGDVYKRQVISNAPLHAGNGAQAADMGDVGRFRRPG